MQNSHQRLLNRPLLTISFLETQLRPTTLLPLPQQLTLLLLLSHFRSGFCGAKAFLKMLFEVYPILPWLIPWCSTRKIPADFSYCWRYSRLHPQALYKLLLHDNLRHSLQLFFRHCQLSSYRFHLSVPCPPMTIFRLFQPTSFGFECYSIPSQDQQVGPLGLFHTFARIPQTFKI